MKIKFLVFGKLKDKTYVNLVEHFLKNLNFFVESNIIELKDLPDPKVINNNTISQLLNIESEQILKHISQKDYLLICDSRGKQLDSVEYANHIQTIIDKPQYQNLVILIGSSNGIAEHIKQKANFLISFGKMTFPHNLMRVMLLEQTYRAFTIINHRNYHK